MKDNGAGSSKFRAALSYSCTAILITPRGPSSSSDKVNNYSPKLGAD
jgi:hypothetical protein